MQPVAPAGTSSWVEVKRWRQSERQRLIAARLAIPAEDRRRHAARIADALDRLLDDVSGRVVTAYWPFRGEPDLLDWLDALRARGATCALPVVTAPQTPLIFRQWQRGAAVTPGIWNIPVPVEDRQVVPDVVIAPLVGFDPEGYRLGHGGGFFDRTLASLVRRPRVVGVGYARLALPTIHPQPHDIPMDFIVTEEGTTARP
jgi:5-formyltetrahydrofolate cyclo-ligase